MLFMTPDGQGTTLALAPKRQPFRLDEKHRRIIRGHAWEEHRRNGHTVKQIAEAFDLAPSTVRADLAELRAARDAT